MISAIATDASSNVYVADAGRVQKFTSTGTFLTKWGSQGAGNGQFTYLSGLAIDSAGAVYAADPGTGNGGNPPRIQKFSSTGTFISKFGSQGYGDGQFDQLKTVAVDRFGGVYVAEATNTNNNHRIQRFKPVQ